MTSGVKWTPERVELLRFLWSEGLSASHIAARMGGGLTRSSVLGKVHRLKMPSHKAVAQPKPKPAPKPRPTLPALETGRPVFLDKVDPLPERAEAWAALPGTTPVAMADLGEMGRPAAGGFPARVGQCRWPIGESPMLFCGCEATSQYCVTHAAMARGRGVAA